MRYACCAWVWVVDKYKIFPVKKVSVVETALKIIEISSFIKDYHSQSLLKVINNEAWLRIGTIRIKHR